MFNWLRPLKFCVLVILLGQAPFFSWANLPDTMTSDERPKELKNVGIQEKIGAQLNLSEEVMDESGNKVPLSKFFQGQKPVIFTLVYFACPGLCNFHLNGLTEGLKELDWKAGQKFDVVALSFDPKENAELAAKKKQTYMNLYATPGSESGWHFVTADEATIKRLAQTVGFSYEWDEAGAQWSHASAAIMVTPDGKIARYLPGVVFEAPTLKMALTEAGEGKVGGFVDKAVLYCFKYDPHQSKYTLVAGRMMQLGGGFMILVLGALLVPAWLKNRRSLA